tara:strand:- start:373 stop:1521 length:1149 start_codon:yes stop_codon:yes gene_type:complete
MTLRDLNPQVESYATQVVERVIAAAQSAGASDIHFETLPGLVQIRLRISGRLVEYGDCPDGHTTKILARIKALARLITYRSDIPQEGRFVLAHPPLEARVGTLPTLHGERAVIRLANRTAENWLPAQLGLPSEIESRLVSSLARPSGVILVAGPAGAGKTTTAYSGLRYLQQHARYPRSLVTLEDPIESEVAGVSQSQINPSTGYDWADGLKALLRQDPEVMLVGEIRDPATAAVVFQAAMTGQLVITTMHARTAADALRRLLDMQVSPHHLRSVLELLVCQRLISRTCPCRRAGGSPENLAEKTPETCVVCHGSGYHGRSLLVEMLPTIDGELAKALVQEADTSTIEKLGQEQGMRTLAERGAECISRGEVESLELARHLG